MLQKQVHNLSGKVIHVVSVQYIFYLQCYSGKISIWKFCPIDIYINYTIYVATKVESRGKLFVGKAHSIGSYI